MDDSDFGKGYYYPLALFMAHCDAARYDMARTKEAGLTMIAIHGMGGAKDHLYEFDPELAPSENLREKSRQLRHVAVNFPMDATPEDIMEIFDEAKALFFAIDEHFNNHPEEAKYQ